MSAKARHVGLNHQSVLYVDVIWKLEMDLMVSFGDVPDSLRLSVEIQSN